MMVSNKSARFAAAAALIMTFTLAACAPAATQTPAPAVTATTAASTTIPQTNNPAAEVATDAPAEGGATTEAGPAAVTCTKLNLNDLTEDQLKATIPDFPDRMVREFFEYRPYVSIQQFRREIGKYVDQTQVTAWEAYVYVPVDPNQSDEESLMQIPGVDAAVAASLVSARPYASNQAFIDALSAQIGADQAAQASCFLSQ